MTYTIKVKRVGKPDIIKTGVDELNSILIPTELKIAYPKAFQQGLISVEVIEEKQ